MYSAANCWHSLPFFNYFENCTALGYRLADIKYVLQPLHLPRKKFSLKYTLDHFQSSYTKNARRKSCDSSCELSTTVAPTKVISCEIYGE